MTRTLLFIFLIGFCSISFGQQKTIEATKAISAPHIDGELDDAAWQSAPVAKDFVQNFPTYGIPATVRSEVRIVYDDNAVYVGAYLFDNPSLIKKQLTSRDGEQRQDVDYFSVFFDTYNDQQNGFQFLVTTANVQSDARLGGSGGTGFGEYGDKTWDAVWESATSIKKDGWVVEMRIPYISLRFTKKEVQTWGLQLLRFIRRNNESSFWNPVDPNVNGFLNQFGKYTDLKNIQPPLRLSLSPYLSGGIRFNPGDYRKKTEILGSGGMDVKYGLNQSFTLDATLIPDFGQVVSDNLVNNLTPFEIKFDENRPFFTEGTELFNKSGLFYSRRIGATPTGYRSVESTYGQASSGYEIIKNPSVTRLYNAIKFSGRTDNKLGIGVLNAIAAPMHAEIRNLSTKKDSSIQTEPLSNYNLFVLDQAFKGRSSITFTNANVIRNGSARDANTSALDVALYNKKNSHALTATFRYSDIFGYTPYSSFYFMNKDTVTMNGRRYLKPYDGYKTKLQFGKVSGKVRYFASANIESKTFDPNDLGYIQAPNEATYLAGASYNQFDPTKHFLIYNYNLNLYYTNLFQPYSFSSFEVSAEGSWVFKNFWDVQLAFGTQPNGQYDFFELQSTDYKLKRPAFYYTNISGSTDSRKKLFVSYGAGYEHSTLKNSPYFVFNNGIRYRFSDHFTLNYNISRQHDELQIGNAYVPGDKIVGYRNYTDLTSILSGVYNFTSRMNITLRGRHYWSKVHYLSLYHVDAKGNTVPATVSFPVSDLDQNYNIFNVDAFYTWDFRPGSRIIIGWKNWLGDPTSIDGVKYHDYFSNFGRSFGLSHGNEISFRMIYFLDYNQIRRK
jgi:hypothetical protein